MREGHDHQMARHPDAALVGYTYAIYALQAFGALIGLAGGFTEAGKFAFGLPPVVALVMSYLRREAARGSYLASHFRWQIRSFWVACGAFAAALLISAPLIVIGSYILLGAVVLISLWMGYRAVRGVLALRAHRPMPYDPPPVQID